jgi:hypothetical protein
MGWEFNKLIVSGLYPDYIEIALRALCDYYQYI